MNNELKAAIKKAVEAEYELLHILRELSDLPYHDGRIDELIEKVDEHIDALL